MININDKYKNVSGKLRQAAKLYKEVVQSDGQGGAVSTDSPSLDPFWCYIQPVSSGRSLEFAQLVNGTPYNVIARVPDFDIDETYLLKLESKTLHIHSVIDQDERHRYLTILAFEKS
jgi:head-tail adaptor